MRQLPIALMLVLFVAAIAWSAPPENGRPTLYAEQMQKLAPYAQQHWPTAKKRAWLRAKIVGRSSDAQKVRSVEEKLAGMSGPEIDLLAEKYNRRQQELERELGNELKLADTRAGAGNRERLERYRQQLSAARARGVGYRPVITTLPEGAQLGAHAVVSPDRRYVRMTLSPIFSHIPEVSTFNFYTGQYKTYKMPANPWSPYYYQNQEKNAPYVQGNTGFHGTIVPKR